MAEWYGAGLATHELAVASRWLQVRIPPVAAVYQRQLGVPSLRGWLMSISEKLGSKRAYHAIHWPHIRGLAVSADVRLRAKKTEISATLWAKARERTLLLYFYYDTQSPCL